MDELWRVFSGEAARIAGSMGLVWGIGAIALLALLYALLYSVKSGLIRFPKPPSGPVDNTPGSDGSSPDDEAAKKAVEDGVASGKYRWSPTDPNTPPDPSGGGG